MTFEAMNIQIMPYLEYLQKEEKITATRKQYEMSIRAFLSWATGMKAVKETVIRYKGYLQEQHKATTVNVKLAAINGFFTFLGKLELRVKQLAIQRQAYVSNEKELTREEYYRLVREAEKKKNEKLALILQTICSTGIRVSELAFITVEAVRAREATIHLKGKTRIILLPDNLIKKLKPYLREQGITTGSVFVTRTGKPLNRSSIWRMMKALCEGANVSKEKVFPHNLRHLFARLFYGIEKDIVRLADILGHTSVNTTRIYIATSGNEHRKQMEALHLIL